jgi:hypothetical protein
MVDSSPTSTSSASSTPSGRRCTNRSGACGGARSIATTLPPGCSTNPSAARGPPGTSTVRSTTRATETSLPSMGMRHGAVGMAAPSAIWAVIARSSRTSESGSR